MARKLTLMGTQRLYRVLGIILVALGAIQVVLQILRGTDGGFDNTAVPLIVCGGLQILIGISFVIASSRLGRAEKMSDALRGDAER